ncbi:MAG: MFS transporter, partial [Shewanella sp.]
LIASTLMQWFGNNMLYGFMSACTLILFVRLRYVHSQQKAETNITQDYIMATGDLVSSPLAAALDPRVDVESIQEHMTPTANEDTTEFDLGADDVDDDMNEGGCDNENDDEEQLAFCFDIKQTASEADPAYEPVSTKTNLKKQLVSRKYT